MPSFFFYTHQYFQIYPKLPLKYLYYSTAKCVLTWEKIGVAWYLWPHCIYIRTVIVDGQYCSKSSRRNIVRQNIQVAEIARWVARMSMYSTMSLFSNCINSLYVWPWWVHASLCSCDVTKCRTVIRLMVWSMNSRWISVDLIDVLYMYQVAFVNYVMFVLMENGDTRS